MSDTPVSTRLPTIRRPVSSLAEFGGGIAQDWPDRPPAYARSLAKLRATRRLAAAVLWTLVGAVVQAVLLLVPGRAKVVFARLFWSIFCRCIGLSVRVIGTPLRGRRVVFAANHGSWLDIPVLGGQLEACFVAKEEISGWPGVSLVARLGRTVFVSRTRGAIERERDAMQQRLIDGDNLLLFPEGTSSDGCRVLPFRSAFFSIATQNDAAPMVQPVSVAYDRLAGLPAGRSKRAVFAWYGGMDLAPHFWRMVQLEGTRVTVLLHTPLDPAAFASRKELSQAAWDAVATGAAALRQNRGL